jgi:6-phosphogluconolactonase (cycloisomerase 2 family)
MSEAPTSGAVYVQTNEQENRVVAFRRAPDGGLETVGSYPTGGTGDGNPHLPSQGSVVLTGGGRHLLVTNSASDDVTVFRLAADGGLEVVGRTPSGTAPKSAAEHGGLVYVLNTGTATLTGFRLGEGGLEPIAGGETSLSAPDADGAQVGFTPDGSALVVTERGTNRIVSFAVEGDGALGSPQVVASSGPTPYGFAVTAGGTLVVTEAFGAQKGAAAASSYSVEGATVTPATKSVGNGRSEICWAVVTEDGRHAFTTNFADGAVSRYGIGTDGSLSLEDATAGVTVDGRAGLRDLGLTGDGRFLYAVDADSGSVYGWAVDDAGSLSPAGSTGGLPATVAGLAAG